MSTSQMILLGGIAVSTIYLGLPLGGTRFASLRTRAFLNAASAGILLFLLFEILAHATEPVEHALEEAADGGASWASFVALGLLYAAGFGVGVLGLLYLGRLWQRPARPQRVSIGPGAMAMAEAELSAPAAQAAALRTGMGIAAGIGLHDLSEGLAIGQGRRGRPADVGRAADRRLRAAQHHRRVRHRGPAGRRPGAGLLGTIVGHLVQLHLPVRGLPGLAAGALLYVLGELLPVGRRFLGGHPRGPLAGFLLGLATELVLAVAAG